jgi:hypothetical protein
MPRSGYRCSSSAEGYSQDCKDLRHRLRCSRMMGWTRPTGGAGLSPGERFSSSGSRVERPRGGPPSQVWPCAPSFSALSVPCGHRRVWCSFFYFDPSVFRYELAQTVAREAHCQLQIIALAFAFENNSTAVLGVGDRRSHYTRFPLRLRSGRGFLPYCRRSKATWGSGLRR